MTMNKNNKIKTISETSEDSSYSDSDSLPVPGLRTKRRWATSEKITV